MYTYVSVLVYWPLASELCVFVCVCDIKSEYKQKTIFCWTSVKLMPCCTHSKVLLTLRYQDVTCVDWSMISICKTSHQMWHDCLFSKKKKQGNKNSSGGRSWMQRGEGSWAIWKRGNRQYRGLHKLGRLRSLCQLCSETTLCYIIKLAQVKGFFWICFVTWRVSGH